MASELAPTSLHDYRAGDVISDRYVLERKLGEGGMGVVWVAHSSALDVQVALKMLRRELAGTQAVERMAREARTAAQLGHPAMVRVLDFGTTQTGQPFLAMELLEGEELHARLAREQRIKPETAVGLLLPVIDGLGTAHNKGIVHRDIKPENIFIASDGQGRIQPKVLDFGIAKLDRDQNPSRLTQVGDVMGSPFYLSPEQAEGLDDIDFRADIWSIGVVLYEIIVGEPPFAAANYNALIRSILRDNPKSCTERGVGDAQLWTIIERCLRKDREQRWASMWELGEALALWLFERGVRVDASSRSLRHGWLDGTITGLQILVASDAPGAPSEPPLRAVAAAAAAAAAAAVERDADSSIDPEPLARTHLRQKSRGFPKLLVATLLFLGIGLGLGWSQRARFIPAKAVELPNKPAAQAPATARPEEPVVEAVPKSEAMPETAVSALPLEVPSPRAASAAPRTPRGFGKAAPVAHEPAQPAPAAAPAGSARPKAATKAANTEFGF